MELNKKIRFILLCLLITSITCIVTTYATYYSYSSSKSDKKNNKLTSTNITGQRDELYTKASEYSALANRVSTLETNLPALRNKFKSGSLVVTFGSDGYASVPYSTLGVSSRPSYMVITPQFRGYVLLTYMYDSSTSDVKIYAYNVSSNPSTVYSGAMRFSYLIYVD